MQITDILVDYIIQIWVLLAQMGPYLLFGFLVAGILSVFISPQWVETHLGDRGIGSTVKAALFGVPLPLCSCGVIPVSASLYRHGASRSATTSFLLSTPQTGVDSILVTYGLLGPVFAIFRPVAALLTGILGGGAVALLSDNNREKTGDATTDDDCGCDDCDDQPHHNRWVEIFRYGFIALPKDIGPALVAGILIAGLMGALIPPDSLGKVIGGGMISIIILMAAGIPVYVCATASVPIAAGFIHLGVAPGAALAFLIAGPATNAATITTVTKILGRKTAAIYLIAVAVSAVGGGLLLNWLVPTVEAIMPAMVDHHHGGETLNLTGHLSAIVLIMVMLVAYFYRPAKSTRTNKETPSMPDEIKFKIEGMTCSHCAASVQRAARETSTVKSADVNLDQGLLTVTAPENASEPIIAAITALGYSARRI